ncbi:MAG: hypothetical protein N2A99_04765, partial [Carnobacterium alterfunditum]
GFKAVPWLYTSKSVIPEVISFKTPTPFFKQSIYRTKKESVHQFPDKQTLFLILSWLHSSLSRKR